jgi:hypothetical protein
MKRKGQRRVVYGVEFLGFVTLGEFVFFSAGWRGHG